MAKPCKLSFLLIIICVCGVSCLHDTLFHAYQHTSINGWDQSDVLVYNIDTVCNAGTYILSVGVRTTNAYPYKKLWLVVERQMVSPYYAKTDTLECCFVNANEDRDERGTNTYRYIYDIGAIRFEKGQSGIISIRHIMRREILPGISDIGVRIMR